MGWCRAGPGSTESQSPFSMRLEEGDAAEVSSQPRPQDAPRPSRCTTPLKTHHMPLLTSLDFSAVRNPSNLSCQTETYKKLIHTVILRDAITMSLPGGLCWNSPGSHGPVASKGKGETEDHKLCRGGGLHFHYARGLPIPALSLPLLFCSQDLLGESLWTGKPCGTAFPPKVTR